MNHKNEAEQIQQTIKLKDVILRYPKVYTPEEYEKGDGKPRYSALFMLHKEAQADQIKHIMLVTSQLIKKELNKSILPPEAVPLKDGAYKEAIGDEYMYIGANLSSLKGKTVSVVGLNLEPILIGDPRIACGAKVNAVIRLYSLNTYIRINCQLEGIQYLKGSHIKPPALFDTQEGGEEEDAIDDEGLL